MLTYGSWDLPGLDYFQSKNTFKGSRKNFRFSVAIDKEDDDKLTVVIWYGEKCLESSEISLTKSFDLSEQSLYDINAFLTSQYTADET